MSAILASGLKVTNAKGMSACSVPAISTGPPRPPGSITACTSTSATAAAAAAQATPAGIAMKPAHSRASAEGAARAGRAGLGVERLGEAAQRIGRRPDGLVGGGRAGKLRFRLFERGRGRRIGRQPFFDRREIVAVERAVQIEGQQRLEFVAARHVFGCAVFGAHGHPLSKPAAFRASPSFLRA